MASITEFYKYAALATAAYVRMGSNPLDGATFAARAADPNQSGGRMPLSIAQYLFSPNDEFPNLAPWSIAHYYGSDAPANAADQSGFATTLFQQVTPQGTERVLAIRGTEPGFPNERYRSRILLNQQDARIRQYANGGGGVFNGGRRSRSGSARQRYSCAIGARQHPCQRIHPGAGYSLHQPYHWL